MRKSYRFKPKAKIVVPRYFINEHIRAPQVRLIDDTGQMVGVVNTPEALKLAREKALDLVEVAPTAVPPVAKIIDYGKFQYHQEKLLKKAKTQAKKVETKGIRLSLRIGAHDLEVRREQAKEFIKEGNKVKIEMPLRGREHQHTQIAKDIIKKMIKELHEQVPITIEQALDKQMGRLSIIIAPGPSNKPAENNASHNNVAGKQTNG